MNKDSSLLSNAAIADASLLGYCQLAYSNPNVECDNGAEAFFCAYPEETIIAFAGTDSVMDAILDAWAIPWKPRELGVWVHRGVWKQTSALAEKIIPELPRNKKIYVTGHSLGGGIAQQFAALLRKKGFTVARLTTFGSMKSGYEGLAWETCNIPGYRYVREGDTVSTLPLSLFYCHDRPELLLKGDESIFGDHGLEGYKEALEAYQTKNIPAGE